MKVFKQGITLFVILAGLSGFGGSKAFGGWLYEIDKPKAPQINKSKTLHNPTIAQIQNAIKPHTRIDIIGTVDASSGDRLEVLVDDVRLNFKRANKIKWSGDDTWGGFIEVAAKRVQVLNLRMEVNGWGRCRGIIVNTPASDVLFSGCQFNNVADGMIADGEWQRLAVENTKFTKCSDWTSSGDMEGGYGIFLEDDDSEPDHLRLSNVNISLDNSSGQHGVRISKVQNIVIEGSKIGANAKRSLWAYGVEYVSITNSTFETGSVLFNLKRDEWQTDRPTRHVRMWNCLIDHDNLLTPLAIFCGKRTVDVKIKDVDIKSNGSNDSIEVAWREDSGSPSRNICWHADSMTFNGKSLASKTYEFSDWSNSELEELNIGPVNHF
jgi:hypothetical protein